MSDPDRAILLDVEQVAHLLALRPNTIRGWLQNGRLPRVRLSGRAVRVPREAVEQLIVGCTETAGPKARSRAAEPVGRRAG